MWMHGQCDIFNISTHFQRQYSFCNQFTGISADHAGANYLPGVFIKQYFGDAFIASDT